MNNFFLVVQTNLPPGTIAGAIKQAILQIDPELPFDDVQTMQARIDHSLIARRSPAILAGIFAVTALLLASIGLYGVMAYAVAQHTREFGIRLALGAHPAAVLSMVFNQGARLAVIGLAAGVIGALLLTGTLSSLLYGVKGNDPLALAGVALLIGAVAILACWFSARRATKVDPMVALRAE